ncbi:MAG: Flp pilus assembly protein CpaB, partial [Mesorhizobium sp.]
ARKQADQKIDGLAKAVERVGSQLDQMSKAKPAPVVVAAPQPQKEVVKEVVKYVEPEKPKQATVSVFRGIKLESYEVPRQD